MQANYLLLRSLAGVLFLIDVAAFVPYASVVLGEGYWGKSWIKPAWVVPLWVACAGSLITGFYPVVAAPILWLLFRRFYINNRWKNVFRGGGAPGFMSHWTALYLTLFELAALLDGSGHLWDQVLLMFRTDLGVILFCSGTYKSLSGYLKGEGMEYGLANPWWGYFWRFFRKLSPSNVLLKLQDINAPVQQLTMGICLLIPPLRPVGAILLIVGFAYLLPLVRLGRLAGLMMVVAIPALPALPFEPPHLIGYAFGPLATPQPVLTVCEGLVFAFIALLPFVKVMQYVNLFGKKQFPKPFQELLTKYANLVPIIMWRVFTPDVTNFFVRIKAGDRVIADENGVYSYRSFSPRFHHVTESIVLTTVFTTLKYFSSQRALFEERLVAYSRTLGEPSDATITYEYVAILKGETQFDYLHVADFDVSLATGKVTERKHVPDFDYNAPAKYSHIKETVGYGSYVPKTG